MTVDSLIIDKITEKSPCKRNYFIHGKHSMEKSPCTRNYFIHGKHSMEKAHANVITLFMANIVWKKPMQT